MAEKKEPFVQPEDRPEPPDPNRPLGELRVRDLSLLLQNALTLKSLKLELDHHKWQKPEKLEHPKFEKIEKFEHPKFEKLEKFEKHEKLEWEYIPTFPPNAGSTVEGVPTGNVTPTVIDDVVRALSGLSEQVTGLAKEIEALKAKGGR